MYRNTVLLLTLTLSAKFSSGEYKNLYTNLAFLCFRFGGHCKIPNWAFPLEPTEDALWLRPPV